MPNPDAVVIDRLKAIQHTADNGVVFWKARELMGILDYGEWREFQRAIERAQESCSMAGQLVADHFGELPEMVMIGSGAMRERENMALSRYACYLVTMNGDTSKPEIATAQAYFIEKTYIQERTEALTDQQRRVLLRDRLKDANKKLGDAAKNSGVRSVMFGVFHDAGYKGLYGGLNSKAIKTKKGIGDKDSLLDCIGPTELAANEFRATQAKDKLIRDEIKGEQTAINVHYDVAVEVRKTIEKIGGTMPENLPAEPSIKGLKGPAKQVGEIPDES